MGCQKIDILKNPGSSLKVAYSGVSEFKNLLGKSLVYGFRIYNPGIGKFLSVDPITKEYPMLTPYQFASNRPIDGIDLDGLEYDDSKLKIIREAGSNRIKVTGDIEVKIKVINLSSKEVKSEFLKFHNQKSSKAFDIPLRGIQEFIPLDPITGDPNSASSPSRIDVSNLNIDFEFIGVYTNFQEVNNDDMLLLIVDEIPIRKDNIDPVGLAQRIGSVYAIEVDVFNSKYHADTHEKGHIIGEMSDWRRKDGAMEGFLMSYADSGNGYKLRSKDISSLIESILYRRATSKNADFIKGQKQTTLEQDAKDFIKTNNIETKKNE